jgi:hypothetical protein
MTAPSSTRISPIPSIASSESNASAAKPRLLHQTPKSVAPCTITHFGFSALKRIALARSAGLRKWPMRTSSRSCFAIASRIGAPG